MANCSTYLANALTNAVLRNVAYTSPATVYVALYTTNPTAGDVGTEVGGGLGYNRVAVTFDAPSGGASANSGAVAFGPASGSWGTVTHMAIRDAAVAGNLLFFAPLTASKTVGAGDSFQFTAGEIDTLLS